MKAGLDIGSRPVISIVNRWSGITDPSLVAACNGWGGTTYGSVKQVLSGLTANGVYKTLLSITGMGFMDFCGLCGSSGAGATTREIALKITIDGTVAFEGATAISAAANGVIGIGRAVGTNGLTVLQPCGFRSSFLAEIKDNHAETNKLQLEYDYRLVG